MPLTIKTSNVDPLDVETYLAEADGQINGEDIESVIETADLFAGLLRNRRLLSDHINRELERWWTNGTSMSDEQHPPTTFVLGRGSSCYVRANLWFTREDLPRLSPIDLNVLQGAGIAHDHDFHLMTGGYFGPGYETEAWRYDRSRVKGNPGDRACLDAYEKTTLPVGKVMFYERSRDVHRQRFAESLSISLNVMVNSDDGDVTQLNFDPETDTVIGPVNTFSRTNREAICKIAGCLGDGQTSSLLEDIGRTSGSAQIRAAALRALVALNPDDLTRVIELARDDTHPVVIKSLQELHES